MLLAVLVAKNSKQETSDSHEARMPELTRRVTSMQPAYQGDSIPKTSLLVRLHRSNMCSSSLRVVVAL